MEESFFFTSLFRSSSEERNSILQKIENTSRYNQNHNESNCCSDDIEGTDRSSPSTTMKKSKTDIDLSSMHHQWSLLPFNREHPLGLPEQKLTDGDDDDVPVRTLRTRSSSDGKLGLLLRGVKLEDDITAYYQQEYSMDLIKPSCDKLSTMKGGRSSTSADQRGPLPWNVGKISIFILVFFSITDVILHLVDAQMESLEAPDHYDALSADVIRPAFRYHSATEKNSAGKPRLGLGSAAISSVTTALSPILPFTGGVDLRREDYWSNGVFGSISSVVEQVRDAFASSSSSSSSILITPRGGGRPTQTTSDSKKKIHIDSRSTLSNAEPFVPFRDIADLTLNDISLAFRYAMENTRHNFNNAKFMSGLAPRMKKVFDKVSSATRVSRGSGVLKPTTGLSDKSGDMDALEFCAAMRIFAEWRVLRQVPDGYKGYAVGMNLGQKDIVQNVAKIEQAVHTYVQHSADTTEEGGALYSPTLRDLLQYEIDMDVHDNTKLPRLKEKSAAMGLLWVRRQLQYQTAIFAKVFHVPDQFATARDAVTAAYNEVYHKYHGWAVQKIFTYSFKAAPDAIPIYKTMNPRKLKEITESAKTLMNDDTNNNRQRKFGRDIGNRKGKVVEQIGREFEKFGGHVVREWDKFAAGVVQLFGQTPKRRLVEPMRGGYDEIDNALQAKIDDYINQEISKDAHEHISNYLTVVEPILDNLATLISEMNMDDPTKV